MSMSGNWDNSRSAPYILYRVLTDYTALIFPENIKLRVF